LIGVTAFFRYSSYDPGAMNGITIFDYSNQKAILHDYTEHYYGDIVRKLLLSVSILMLTLTPFYFGYIPLPYYIGLFIALFITILSGLTNPKIIWVSVFDFILSFFGTIIFGYYAVDAYLKYSPFNFYFWVNEIIAGIFLISLYYSIKTVRGHFVH
jgi:hypothetical protein